MFFHPMWDPVALKLGSLAIRWYGLAYLLSIIIVVKLGKKAIANGDLQLSYQQFDHFISSAVLGIIIGGRLVYMLFYQSQTFFHNPLTFFKLWQGGMAFHGGFLGVFLALVYHTYRYGGFWHLADFVCRHAAIGLFFGRLANFINGELCGRVADAKHWWLIVYPWLGNEPRHPSQIYEMIGEGLILYFVLNLIHRLRPKAGIVSGSFCLAYGLIRFVLEFFRAPDVQIGFVWHDWLTMGQLLSLPLLLSGLTLIIWRSYDR